MKMKTVVAKGPKTFSITGAGMKFQGAHLGERLADHLAAAAQYPTDPPGVGGGLLVVVGGARTAAAHHLFHAVQLLGDALRGNESWTNGSGRHDGIVCGSCERHNARSQSCDPHPLVLS